MEGYLVRQITAFQLRNMSRGAVQELGEVMKLKKRLGGGGGVGAGALPAGSDFASVVPRLQQSHYREYQNKETPNPSVDYFDSIGGGYLMNVKAETDCVLRRGVDVCLCPAATVVRRSA